MNDYALADLFSVKKSSFSLKPLEYSVSEQLFSNNCLKKTADMSYICCLFCCEFNIIAKYINFLLALTDNFSDRLS